MSGANATESLLLRLHRIPPGPWAVAVSGGADSVCLLHLLHNRPDLALHIVHLNHETRGPDSDADAAFVANLATRCNLPCRIARLSEIHLPHPPANTAARYRAARLALFCTVVHQHHLNGVLLAHHADDQAETILQRLLRGSGVAALAGIAPQSTVGGLTLLHPLLRIRREKLRAELRRHNLPWREDASNRSGKFLRNRLRQILHVHPDLTPALLDLGTACATLRDWLDQTAPLLNDQFPTSALADLPRPLADHALRRWLRDRGAPPQDINPETLDRLFTMATDAASPPRQSFPGNLLARRRRHTIFVEHGKSPSSPRPPR